MKNNKLRRKLFKQKLCGAILIALSVAVAIVASTALELKGADAGAVLLLAPLGLYLMFTKHIVLD